MQTVMSSLVAGAEMITFLAPASMWARALSASVKNPVDSMTMSTPRSPHGSRCGSRSASTVSRAPSMVMWSPSAFTVPGKRPRIESYLRRWASVAASVRSLTATISRSELRSRAARVTLRPIRPKPLMPIFTPMRGSLLSLTAPSGAGSVPATTTGICPIAPFSRLRGLHESVQPAGHRRAADAAALGERGQRRVGMRPAESPRLAERWRQHLPPRLVGAEQLDGLELAHGRVDGAAEVGCLGVERPVHTGTHVAHHPALLESETAALRPDRA